MLMVKKRFCTPELHLIKLDNIQPETDLANLSDDELLKIMQQDDYRKNKVCYMANSNFIARKIAGEVILVPINESGDGLNGMITFNEAGAFLWEQLQKKRTEADLAYLLAKEYQKEPKDVEADVKIFLDGAVKRGFVAVC